MKNIMIDLETMGQGSDAAIVSLGAVYFDENGLGDTFYEAIDIVSSEALGLKIDASTVKWWFQQDPRAQVEIISGHPVLEVLERFSCFVKKGTAIWGDGSDFDNVILAHAYSKTDIPTPWKFWDSRCYRTMKGVYKDVKMDRVGTHHNALDDAISQATHLAKIVKTKGIII